MKQKAFTWTLVLIILFCVSLIGIGAYYYLNKGYSLPETTPSESATIPLPATDTESVEPTQPTTSAKETPETKIDKDQQEAQKVVEQFESWYMVKDEASVLKMFDLFTPPVSQLEKEFYDFLLAKDTPTPSAPRLLWGAAFAYQVLSYKVIDVQKINSNKFRFVVKEQRRFFSNALETKGEIPQNSSAVKTTNEEKTNIFEVVKSNGKWLIDKYYPQGWTQDAETTPLKYGAFY